jgi:hypothetical protein
LREGSHRTTERDVQQIRQGLDRVKSISAIRDEMRDVIETERARFDSRSIVIGYQSRYLTSQDRAKTRLRLVGLNKRVNFYSAESIRFLPLLEKYNVATGSGLNIPLP